MISASEAELYGCQENEEERIISYLRALNESDSIFGGLKVPVEETLIVVLN